jgi:hypothetical protein
MLAKCLHPLTTLHGVTIQRNTFNICVGDKWTSQNMSGYVERYSCRSSFLFGTVNCSKFYILVLCLYLLVVNLTKSLLEQTLQNVHNITVLSLRTSQIDLLVGSTSEIFFQILLSYVPRILSDATTSLPHTSLPTASCRKRYTIKPIIPTY